MEFVPSRKHVSSTCSAFQSSWPHIFQLAEIAAPFSSRGIATTSSMESSLQGSTAVDSDITPRIKFKRLDKTSRHIMQVFTFLSIVGKVVSFHLPFVCFQYIAFFSLQILDKEAVEEAKAQREIPDIKPGYIVQLKVVKFSQIIIMLHYFQIMFLF